MEAHQAKWVNEITNDYSYTQLITHLTGYHAPTKELVWWVNQFASDNCVQVELAANK